MKSKIDQDDFALVPIVWSGHGVVCGNSVTLTVRNYGGAYVWMARVESTLGWTSALTGASRSLEVASEELNAAVQEMLEVEEP